MSEILNQCLEKSGLVINVLYKFIYLGVGALISRKNWPFWPFRGQKTEIRRKVPSADLKTNPGDCS